MLACLCICERSLRLSCCIEWAVDAARIVPLSLSSWKKKVNMVTSCMKIITLFPIMQNALSKI